MARQARIEQRAREIQRAEDRDRHAHRLERAEPEPALDERRQRGEQSSHGVTRIEQHVVPGEDARAIGVRGRRGKERLLEDRDRAAIASVHVEHADEGRDRHERRAFGREQQRPAGNGKPGEHEQHGALRIVRSDHERRERSRGRSPQRRREHDADFDRGEAHARRVKPEEDRDEPDAERAQERRGVEDAANARAVVRRHRADCTGRAVVRR